MDSSVTHRRWNEASKNSGWEGEISYDIPYMWNQKRNGTNELTKRKHAHRLGMWKPLSCVWLFVTPWTIQSMEFTGQNTGVGSLFLHEGIFPTQGLNPGLLHCRQILYQLSHQGSPRILEWVACPFSSGSFPPRNWTGSPSLQVDSLPTELSGKPHRLGEWTYDCWQGRCGEGKVREFGMGMTHCCI